MNISRLNEIINESVTRIDSNTSKPVNNKLKLIKLHFFSVIIDVLKAEFFRVEFTAMMNEIESTLVIGPSYITVGVLVEDQTRALEVFAIGEALNLWKVLIPEKFGLTGQEANNAAGNGFVMISPYRKVNL